MESNNLLIPLSISCFSVVQLIFSEYLINIHNDFAVPP